MPVIEMTVSPVMQWLVFIVAFVVKPLYMVLSLVLIVVLWKRPRRYMVILRWSLLSFFIGEAACAVNYVLPGGTYAVLDVIHGAGMVGMSALLPWALFLTADEKILNFSHPVNNCAMLKLCGSCWKHKEVPCGLKRLFLFLAPTLAVTALIPLAAKLEPAHYALQVLGVKVDFIFPQLMLTVELRCYPIIAAGLLVLSLLTARGGPEGVKRSQPFFFIGLGFLLFSMFRFVLVSGFMNRPHWFNFWEEATELLAVIGIGFFLWVFHKQLGIFKSNQKQSR